ncbi:TetR/AcrR family transcriptional regulator [Nocardiopsis sp. N85]|uniref:TetR/AcrR family transcriptional regulator n=1 Tax=Nocardiopsis sp. N85 TaxID=3029400 RepID=UPI00237F810B|nr:TetR/AcrR family transcriptional regulator [Nocardiopsis sp. N85]MDE3721312.1 TetR/AcrR family transcriptional regulator [Nocardiopsis sp. N85]
MTTERGRQVRERLLAAATHLIADRGWSAVSTRVLAEQAGVGPGLVHYHYPSLRALLNEAALDSMTAVAEQAAAGLQGTSPHEGLELMLGALEAYPGDDPTSVLFVEVYLAATRDEELRRGITAILQRFRAVLADWLRAGGVADPEATARILASAIDGVMLHRALDPHLDAATVAPVLSRLLHPDAGRPPATDHSTQGRTA